MTKRQLEKVRAKFENFDLSLYHILTYDEMLKVNGGCSSDDDSDESESLETSSESADFSDSGSVTESASGTATETSTESVSETCGHEIENSNEAVANAEVGDTLTRNDGTEVTITQGDIDWAQDYCDAHGIGWSRSGEEEAKANDGAKEGGQAASAENQTELENYDYDSGSSSSIKEMESDYITDEKSGHEAKNEVSENSSAVSKSDKSGKEATEISSSRKNGNDCPDYVERCRMRDEMIAAKRNSELNCAPKNDKSTIANTGTNEKSPHFGFAFGGKMALIVGCGFEVNVEYDLKSKNLTASLTASIGTGIQFSAKNSLFKTVKDMFFPKNFKDVLEHMHIGAGNAKDDYPLFSTSRTVDVGAGIVGTYDLDNLNKSGLPNDISLGTAGGGVWWNASLNKKFSFGD